MILSSCATGALMMLSSIIVFLTLPFFLTTFKSVIQKLSQWDIKGMFHTNPLLPLTVPAMVVFALTISLVVFKEIKVNNTPLITYKECPHKSAPTKVVRLALPQCFLASR